MCGIAGTWSGELGRDEILAALDRMAHRGPDGRGVYADEAVGVRLGHVRLAIIDPSDAGAQPMADAHGEVTLVFNGEIYNFNELRDELKRGGVVFKGHSDTEVLLQLYRSEGLAMLPRLNGIFAFAIHDRRNGELLVVRDGMGVKPLYYTELEGGFAFASELKGLLPMLGAEKTLDHVALARYLTYLWCPGDGTPLASVRKLAPGEWLRVRDGRVLERKRWYTPALLRSRPSVRTASSSAEAVEQALRTAVHRQLVADVPVGAFLSGGLDSSAVVAFAREQVPDIRCFTIATPGGRDAGETDDLPYAHLVAKHLDVRLDVVEVDAARMASSVERMIWQLDEPLADPAPLNVLFISELARASGIKVLLSGAGGDDLFTGYRRHAAVRYERLWSWLPQAAREGLASTAASFDQRSGAGRRIARLFSGAHLPGDQRLAAFFAWGTPGDVLDLLRPEVRAEVARHPPAQTMLDFLGEMPPDRSSLDRMLALEQRFFLADHNLTYTDKMSMAAGVEVRVPFLDADLVELAARIPDGHKQRGSAGKWVLKKALEPHLPHGVVHRPKTGFGAPLRRWLRNELRELMLDLLSADSLRRRHLFDVTAVHRLIDDNETGRRDGAYLLFSMMCIEIWCRRFVDVDAAWGAHGR